VHRRAWVMLYGLDLRPPNTGTYIKASKLESAGFSGRGVTRIRGQWYHMAGLQLYCCYC